jgi:hypothetical protein
MSVATPPVKDFPGDSCKGINEVKNFDRSTQGVAAAVEVAGPM